MSTYGSRTRRLLHISFEGGQNFESDSCYVWPPRKCWTLEVNGVELSITFRKPTLKSLRYWSLGYGIWATPVFIAEFWAGQAWFNEVGESGDWPQDDEQMKADVALNNALLERKRSRA
jgi:hypothetical protein